MKKPLTQTVIRIEYLLAAVLVAVFFTFVAEYQWYWLIVFFLVFDISMVGYLINNRVGAVTYNIGHSLIGPFILLATYMVSEWQWALFVALIWLFHILIDRGLGYGLKLPTGFQHTHLGKIGKK